MADNPQSKRVHWLDLVKGLAMVAIVYGHVTSDWSGVCQDAIYSWVYAWHVPIFALVTGLIQGRRISSLSIRRIPHRVRTILVPYITFSLVYIVGMFLFVNNSVDWLQRALSDTIMLKGCGALWFLPAILIAQIITSSFYSATKYIFDKPICRRLSSMKEKDQNLWIILILGCVLASLYVIAVKKELAITECILFERCIVLAFWMFVGVSCHTFFFSFHSNILITFLFGVTSFCLSQANGLRELWGGI